LEESQVKIKLKEIYNETGNENKAIEEIYPKLVQNIYNNLDYLPENFGLVYVTTNGEIKIILRGNQFLHYESTQKEQREISLTALLRLLLTSYHLPFLPKVAEKGRVGIISPANSMVCGYTLSKVREGFKVLSPNKVHSLHESDEMRNNTGHDRNKISLGKVRIIKRPESSANKVNFQGFSGNEAGLEA